MSQPATAPQPTSGFRLTRYFIGGSFVAFLLILGPLVYLEKVRDDFLHRMLAEQDVFFRSVQDRFAKLHKVTGQRNMLAIHEAGSVNLTQLFANTLWEKTFAPLVAKTQRIPAEHCRAIPDVEDAGGKAVPLADKKACYVQIGAKIKALPEFRGIDARVSDAMKKSSVFKIKVYDLRGITVYSSDHGQIGEDKFRNPGWKSAAAGKPASALTHRNKFSAFEGAVENRDLIETYIPATAPGSDRIIGVFEIYSDVTPLLDNIKRSAAQIETASAEDHTQWERGVDAIKVQADEFSIRLLTVVLGLLALLYGALFLVVRNGQRIIDGEKAERVQAEAALAESEARFRSLTNMSSDFYWESDAEHRLTQRAASKREAAESVFQQMSPIGQRRWEMPYVSPDESGWQKHRAMLDAHLPFRDFEISRLAADGIERHVSISGDPVFDASGRFRGYRGVGADITERKRAQAALQESEAHFRSLTELAADWYWEQDDQFRFIDLSDGLRERLGSDGQLGKTRWELASFSVSEERWARHRADLEAHKPFRNFEYALLALDGKFVYVSASGMPIFDERGTFKGYRGASRDITARKLAETDLRIAATAFEAQEGMVVTDAENTILRVNRAFTEITGYTAAEAIGQSPRLLRSGRHDAAFYRAMWDSVLGSGTWKGEIWNRRKSGEVYPEWLTITAVKDGDGVITNFVATLTDITRRKAAEEEIKNLAFYDPLTQLPNRRLLMDRLHQALASSDRSRHRGALLFIDLDHFKTLNDTLGHDKGDLLLQQVAQRLTACVRQADTVARLGGDEFVVMLEELSEAAEEATEQAGTIAEKILATFNQPYILAGHPHQSSGSIGVAPFCGHELGANVLLKHADIAMYQAKAGDRNALRFFEPGMQAAIAAKGVAPPVEG